VQARRSDTKGTCQRGSDQRQRSPRCTSLEDLQSKTREVALVELKAKHWLRAGEYFRGTLIGQLAANYGPRAEEAKSPAHSHVQRIAEALRGAITYLTRVGDARSEDDDRLRRLLQRMQADGVLAERFDRGPQHVVSAEAASTPQRLWAPDPIGTMIPSHAHSRKLLVDAIRREHWNATVGPPTAPRRVALLCIVAGWWPETATLDMTPSRVIALEEKSARQEIGRQDKRQAAGLERARHDAAPHAKAVGADAQRVLEARRLGGR
jgi:hypothetical protein